MTKMRHRHLLRTQKAFKFLVW